MGSKVSKCFCAGAPLDEYEMELLEQAVNWREREKRLRKAEIVMNERKWITVSSLLFKNPCLIVGVMSMPFPLVGPTPPLLRGRTLGPKCELSSFGNE